MSGVRLDLANPNTYSSPKEYIEKHLAPIATELHRLANEMIAPGSTAEIDAVDMVPGNVGDYFRRFDRPLKETAKRVVFDGSEYFSIPRELLRSKQAKVQFSGVLYILGRGAADFRLVRDDGDVVQSSSFHISSDVPEIYTAVLPFGDQPGSICPTRRTYYIEGGTRDRCTPVCRRFSLSFVYL